MKNDYHIIIFSRLQNYDGGRETWLNQFLPLLKEEKTTHEIFVYHFIDDNSDPSQLISNFYNSDIKYEGIVIPNLKNIIHSLLRIIIFSSKVIYKLRENNNKLNKSIFIGVGGFYEGGTLWAFKTFSLFKKPRTIVWLRGIWPREIRARHSKLIALIVQKLEKVFLKSANQVISNGLDTQYFYHSHLNITSTAIPNAIDLSRFYNKKTISERLIISYVGRLSKEKGILDYLRSIEYFNSNFPESKDKVQFEIVGAGPLKYLVENFKETNTSYLGEISNDNIPNYLSRINVGVALTYFNEEIGGGGLSNGLLEIIASKALVVAWDNKIFKQILDTKSAFLIEEENWRELGMIYNSILLDEFVIKTKTEIAYNYLKDCSFENHMRKFMKLMNS